MFLPIHSNIKTDSTPLKLANKNLLCRTCVRRRQHIRLPRTNNSNEKNCVTI